MNASTYATLGRIADFLCWNTRLLLVLCVSLASLTLSMSVAGLGYVNLAKCIYYFAALADVLILCFATRLPTRAIYKDFMDTYRKGPWTKRRPMEAVPNDMWHISQISGITNRIDGICKELLDSGASKESVFAWRKDLAQIVTKLL